MNKPITEAAFEFFDWRNLYRTIHKPQKLVKVIIINSKNLF